MNILNKLTIKHLKLNKKRTLVTIIGIILSTALMVGIGTLISSFREFMINTTIETSGREHVTINDISYDNYKYIKNNIYVEDTFLRKIVGYSKYDSIVNKAKPYFFIEEVNDNILKDTTLISGRLPKNNSEVVISNHIITNGKVDLKVGDNLKLDIGSRYIYNDKAYQNTPYVENEIYKKEFTKEYKIVGIIERENSEPFSAPGYTIYSKIDESKLNKSDIVTTSIIYKNIKDTVKKTENICKVIKGDVNNCSVDYNNSLLSLSGESSYNNLNDTLFQVITVILILITIGCAIVIYNSFAISVMERKKQFGLFSSIGATKTQLKKTVFFEAFIVSIIGIPIGILSGIFGIYVVLNITNNLLKGVFNGDLTLALYPAFIIIPIIYMIITIIISAYLPAKKASKVSPIESIRLNDDIKIKKKNVKSNKLIRKIFGIEGELAYKNIKRNKKKYRITILSLFISIVLFISFSTFLEYGNQGSRSMLNIIDYDVTLEGRANESDDIYGSALSIEGIDDYSIINLISGKIHIDNKLLTKESRKVFKDIDENINDGITLTVISLDNNSYKDYIKELKLNYNDYKGNTFKPILINKGTIINDDMSTTEFTHFNIKNNYKADIDILYNLENNNEYKRFNSNIYVTKKIPKYVLDYIDNYPVLIVSENMLNLGDFSYGKSLKIKSDEHEKVYEQIKKIVDSSIYSDDYYVEDVTMVMQLENNIVLVVGIFLYGFISLVTLIGITSVFNTINTSIALRRKEFAILRSVGLNKKGFNRMIRFESLFYGLKALIYSLPVSFVIIYIFHRIFGNVISFSEMLIPWTSIIICIIGVFVITFLTMAYSSSKIKKENILDAIREENI